MKKVSSRFSLFCSPPLIKAAAFLTCLALSQSVFAATAGSDAEQRIQNAAERIKDIITGDIVKIILGISLCCSAVAYAMNKDNEKIKRGALAVGIACVIIMSATAIVDFMMKP
jgi:type IV secretory pathway VirB2 component (pilin)